MQLFLGYAQNDMSYQAIEFYKQIRDQGILLPADHQETNEDVIKSNNIIHLSVIDALADFCDLSTAESIVEQIPISLRLHPYLHNALIHMWVRQISVMISIIELCHC